MDDFPPDGIRSSSAVARRALALFSVVAVAFGADRETVLKWLADENLLKELSPIEQEFMAAVAPSDKQEMNAGWYSERLVVLLWTLRLAMLPEADEQCDTSVFLDLLPPYVDVDAAEFVTSATLRPADELTAMAEVMLDLHWEARDALIHGREPSGRVDLGIIQERHHAINWVLGYEGAPWDEVATDT